MTSIDSVWANVKQSALQYAKRGQIPNASEARILVLQFISEARCDPRPPEDAVEFFVSELVTLAAEFAADSPTARLGT